MTKVLVLDNATEQIKEIELPDPVSLSLPVYVQAGSLLRIPIIASAYILAYTQAGTGLQIGVIT